MSEDKPIAHTNIEVRSLIWRLYRASADEDYLVARLSYRHGIIFTFWWHAQQAVEKYLKAAALLNGVSTSKAGHNLTELLRKVKGFSGSLLPSEISPKSYFDQSIRAAIRAETLETIINRIEEYGATSSRYRHNSILAQGYWLHQLDELIFLIRRLTYPLDMPCGPLVKTFRELLSDDKKWEPHSLLPFKAVIGKRSASFANSMIRWRNFSFCEESALKAGQYLNDLRMVNTPLFTIDASNGGAAALEWLLANAYFSPTEKAELSNHASQLKSGY